MRHVFEMLLYRFYCHIMLDFETLQKIEANGVVMPVPRFVPVSQGAHGGSHQSWKHVWFNCRQGHTGLHGVSGLLQFEFHKIQVHEENGQ